MISPHLEIASEALNTANQRREVARKAVAEFALRAILDGNDIDEIMQACGFIKSEKEENPAHHQGHVWSIFGEPRRNPRQEFAAWIANEIIQIIEDKDGVLAQGQD